MASIERSRLQKSNKKVRNNSKDEGVCPAGTGLYVAKLTTFTKLYRAA